MKKWIKTDDYQFLQKIGDREYDIINIMKYPKGYFVLLDGVFLNEYSDEEIEEYLTSYGYRGIEDLEEEYEESTDQVLAEIISEIGFNNFKYLDYQTKDQVNAWLKEEISEKLYI